MNDNFGPKPWHQTNWDFRAALNFMFGSAGAGLLVAAANPALAGNALRVEILLGLALIGAGLISVWFEIGRPLRAMNVGFNPFTSWMTRESFAAGLVFPLGLAAVWMEAGRWRWRRPWAPWSSPIVRAAFCRPQKAFRRGACRR